MEGGEQTLAAFLSSTHLPTMIKPVMNRDVEERIENYIQQYNRNVQWKLWGMDKLRDQGGALLLEGPPGTGKTTIARYLSTRIGKGFKELDVAKMPAGEGPGDYERAIDAFFSDARARNNMLIFMDECDHLLLSRDQIGEAGKTWQLGGVERLMVNMNTYKGPIICATNHVGLMDTALDDRFLDIIKIDVPDLSMRKRLWKQKVPRQFPLQLNVAQVETISHIQLTGRRIETVIINTALEAMRLKVKPTFAMLHKFAERSAKQRIK